MSEPAPVSKPLSIAVIVSLLVTAACALLPAVNGPATAVDEIALGLAPAALVLAVTFFLSVRQRGAVGASTRGWVLGVALAVMAAGSVAGMVGYDEAKSARSRARSASSRSMGSPYGGYGGYDEAAGARRKARHYGDAMMLGFGVAGFGLVLVVLGLVVGRPKELPIPA